MNASGRGSNGRKINARVLRSSATEAGVPSSTLGSRRPPRLNFRKHHPNDRRAIDPCSSAAWFDGFRTLPANPIEPSPTWQARTWLATKGWRRHGLIDCRERPKPS